MTLSVFNCVKKMLQSARPNLVKAVSYVVCSSPKRAPQVSIPKVPSAQTVIQHPQRLLLTRSHWLLKTASMIGQTGMQVRFIKHGDMEVPDFDKYRRNSLQDPCKSSRCSEDARNNFTYFIVLAGSLGAAYSCKAIVAHYVNSMAATADVLAMAQIEIKLAEIPVGKHVTFKWRGKPLFIWHRTPESIAEVRAVPVNLLRDPERDEDRVQQENWLVVIGVCTHLGCVPLANAGDYGGYYCPCHGSHYDASGRIRKGPAPTNLDVPPYTFPTDDTLLVG